MYLSFLCYEGIRGEWVREISVRNITGIVNLLFCFWIWSLFQPRTPLLPPAFQTVVWQGDIKYIHVQRTKETEQCGYILLIFKFVQIFFQTSTFNIYTYCLSFWSHYLSYWSHLLKFLFLFLHDSGRTVWRTSQGR